MMVIGKIIIDIQAAVIVNAMSPKLARILSKACPDVILAKRRTAKLIMREKFEIISIKIIKGVIINGDPLGKKWFNVSILLS